MSAQKYSFYHVSREIEFYRVSRKIEFLKCQHKNTVFIMSAGK